MPNTLRQLIDYSKANPNSDVAKNTYQHIVDGGFDTQAKQEGIDLTWAGRPAPVQPTPTQGNKDSGINGDLFQPNPLVAGAVPKVLNAVTQSEQNFGKDLAQTAYLGLFGGQKQIDSTTKQYMDNGNTFTELAKKQTDPALKQKYAQEAIGMYTQAQKVGGSVIGNVRTPEQIVGDALGTALDIGLAGSYGKAAAGAESGKLLVKSGGALETIASKVGIPTSEKIISPAVESVGKQALGQTLKTIVKNTAINTAKGAGIGYGYDVSQNLQQNKQGTDIVKPGMGTLVGGAIPAVIGVGQAGMAITKETAPKFINSLIKPSKANFAYGKNPGKTVSEMGITGNNLNDFGNNIVKAKQDVGSMLGESYKFADAQGVTVDATGDIAKLDSAIHDAAKGGKNNQSVVNSLQNIKDALLYDHQVNADGVIEKVGTTPSDVSKLTPTQAFNLKDQIYSMTRFNGTPSDDKTVNSVLKSVASGLKDNLNDVVKPFSPEIVDLNQKYADLASAQLAVQNREAIVGRQNLISLKAGGAGAIVGIGATILGRGPIGGAIAGATATAVEKALESTAVKTRIAAWLGSETPSKITQILQKNPQIRTVLLRALPKFASQINGQTP